MDHPKQNGQVTMPDRQAREMRERIREAQKRGDHAQAERLANFYD